MGQTTLIDLMVALKRHGATLKLQLESGGAPCTVTVEWVTRPMHVGIFPADNPRERTFGFTGSLEDVINTLIAWIQEDLPVTFFSAAKGGELTSNRDKES